MGRLQIGRKVFIGINSLIVNAIDIGDGAVISVGSVINRDIPPKELWVENPVRFIKKVE